jgi:hypothetical protein
MSAIKTYLAINEAARLSRNQGDFTRTQTAVPKAKTPEDAEGAAFFKLIATASNLHSAIADFYLSKGDPRSSKYHTEIANRLRAESNRIKNV